MRPEKLFCGLLVMTAVLLTTAARADVQLLSLRNNPFTRPPVFEKKPPPSRPVVVEKVDPIELELTATMVSDSASMVIVEGELIAIGESFKGMKLLKVMEGKAVFAGAGKKMTYKIEPAVE
jgi:hypothetical protein